MAIAVRVFCNSTKASDVIEKVALKQCSTNRATVVSYQKSEKG